MGSSVLVVTDNQEMYEHVRAVSEGLDGVGFTFVRSPAKSGQPSIDSLEPFDLKRDWEKAAREYDLVISVHCKQLFPAKLVSAVRCINVHPGFNPHNRGWYPQVFSILNKLPCGATIHEIDEEIDHGGIIARREVPLFEHDTSLTLYRRVLQAEKELIVENARSLVDGTYTTFAPEHEGNVNAREDFERLRRLDLDRVVTMREAIDHLRALTHGDFKNAYFITAEGERVYVRVDLEAERS